jgi:transposase
MDCRRPRDRPAHLYAFIRGLDLDKEAVHVAVTLPYHNGGTEGVNTKTKRIIEERSSPLAIRA